MYFAIMLILEALVDWPTAMWVLLAADLLSLFTIPFILYRRAGRPLACLSWVMAVLAFPFFGVVLWWLIGDVRLKRHRQRLSARLGQHLASPCLADPDHPSVRRLARIIPASVAPPHPIGIFPPMPVDHIEIMPDGRKAFYEMEAALLAAQEEILILFYIWRNDTTGRKIRDILVEQAKKGVRVRVLVDSWGSTRFFTRRFAKPLKDAGAHVGFFLPTQFRPWNPTFNFRNHRKLIVVDRKLAITGGMNIGDEYRNSWTDLAITMEGPVVEIFRHVFEEDWYFASGESLPKDTPMSEHQLTTRKHKRACAVIASGPDMPGARFHDSLYLAISGAKKRVWMTTPYFIPSEAVISALRGAALQGVDVRVMVPQNCDLKLVGLASKTFYPTLMEAGVKFFEYYKTMIHTKSLVVDNDLSIFGSANTDIRSFRLNFELSCLLVDPEFNQALAARFEDDLVESDEVTMADVLSQPAHKVVLQSAAHLLSPLM